MLGSCGKKRRLGREVCASWGRPSANSEDRSKSPFLKITMLTTWREDGQGGEPRGRKTREAPVFTTQNSWLGRTSGTVGRHGREEAVKDKHTKSTAW